MRPSLTIATLLMAPLLLAACMQQPPASTQPWKRHLIDHAGAGADGVRAADANGDDRPDLVVGWEQSGQTTLYLSTNSPNDEPRWVPVPVGTTPDVEDALLIDLDGDGALDVVSATEGETRKVFVHWAPSNRTDYADAAKWTTDVLYADGSRWMYSVSLDVDGNKRPDLILGGKDHDATVGWLEAPDRPRRLDAWTFHPITPAGWVMSLLVEDMNADGYPDLLLSDRRGKLAGVRWLEHPGVDSPDLRKPWKNHFVGATGREVMFISAADLDGDGLKEIVVPHFLEDDWKLSIFKRETDERWVEHTLVYPASAGRPKSVAVGDIDLDGRPDLVLATGQAYGERRGIVWLRNAGWPFDTDWQTYDVSGPDGIKFDLSLLLDVDRDGDLDVLNTEENDNAAGGNPGLGVVWYENPTLR